MSLVVRPQREDYFPKLKRGHGSTHPRARFDKEGVEIRKAHPCIDPTCVLNAPKSSNQHQDPESNMKDWCEDHRVSLRSKDRPRGRFKTPGQAIHAITGGL